MKKILLLILSLLWIFSANAQRSFNATFLACPQIGWLLSDSKNVLNESGRLGFGYGIEGDLFLRSESYSITTGLTVSSVSGQMIYNQGENFRFSGKVLPSGTKVTYKLNNLEIPFALKLRSRYFDRTRFFAQFGLTNWLNIKAKATTSDKSFENESVADEIRFYNLGLNLGGGVEYDLGENNLLTGGIVFSNGFMDATSNRDVKDDTSIRVLRFRIGFVF